MFGHLLPLFITSVPGVIFNGDPPYSLWEHPPAIGRIPPHRSDAGSFLLAECFGLQISHFGKRRRRPVRPRSAKSHTDANLIREIDTAELKQRNLESLPFERVLLDLLDNARQLKSFQIVNGRHPDRITRRTRW
jgi:molybdenum storage protein